MVPVVVMAVLLGHLHVHVCAVRVSGVIHRLIFDKDSLVGSYLHVHINSEEHS